MESMRTTRPLMAALAAGFALSLAAPQASANPFEKTLPNGMKMIVKEDRRAPTAVQMVWYRAGSIDEVDGIDGRHDEVLVAAHRGSGGQGIDEELED